MRLRRKKMRGKQENKMMKEEKAKTINLKDKIIKRLSI
jgi:hypothetical protein